MNQGPFLDSQNTSLIEDNSAQQLSKLKLLIKNRKKAQESREMTKKSLPRIVAQSDEATKEENENITNYERFFGQSLSESPEKKAFPKNKNSFNNFKAAGKRISSEFFVRGVIPHIDHQKGLSLHLSGLSSLVHNTARSMNKESSRRTITGKKDNVILQNMSGLNKKPISIFALKAESKQITSNKIGTVSDASLSSTVLKEDINKKDSKGRLLSNMLISDMKRKLNFQTEKKANKETSQQISRELNKMNNKDKERPFETSNSKEQSNSVNINMNPIDLDKASHNLKTIHNIKVLNSSKPEIQSSKKKSKSKKHKKSLSSIFNHSFLFENMKRQLSKHNGDVDQYRKELTSRETEEEFIQRRMSEFKYPLGKEHKASLHLAPIV
eukprot:CAMPEP_0170534672 /NCGR_PEP_ID=MMETSP0209-20121228/93763_1 /TAXON_ID=665100 ORGANISM="Litonotus pictus, Strain P1" /NCGR_SAMPLE_ID=MMETSP0209 /ASSEMBLY_ACC=CAM_ASM_000301 /LENGTH=382 /DNA_ID=CAMNT_0010834443 /DNA_START=186 /DNA_END=1331 /DNA_ORIENTATION=-